MSKLNKMKTGRNKPCPCGSGKKFKVCCRAEEPTVYQQFRARWEAEQAAKEQARKRSQEYQRRMIENRRLRAVTEALRNTPIQPGIIL